MRARLGGVLVLALSGALVATLLLEGRTLLEALPLFRVETVHVEGVRLLEPQAVIAVSGIGSGSSVFSDRSAWVEGIVAHPLVRDARIERNLPRTLRIRVSEVEPVAFAATPRLWPVDAEGRVLPVDLAGVDLDLPVLATPSAVGANGMLVEPAAHEMLRLLDGLRRAQPELAGRISELGVEMEGQLRLVLRDPPRVHAVFAAGAGPRRFRELELVLADIQERGELARLRHIDLRFHDQVVVALNPSARD